MKGIYPISDVQMMIGLIPIIIAIAISYYYRLGLTKSLLIGVVRATVQLGVMGYVLAWVFRQDNPWFISLLLLLMVSVATQAGLGRLKNVKTSKWKNILRTILFICIFASSVITAGWLQFLVIRPEPLWEGMYVIPIAGMLINQAMTSGSLALERYRSELEAQAPRVLALLALGATQRQASHEVGKTAIGAAMMPTINSMMVLGIVALPGMMSGQILSGVDPLLAVRYQLLIYFCIAATNALSAFLAVELTRRFYFTAADQFVLPENQ